MRQGSTWIGAVFTAALFFCQGQTLSAKAQAPDNSKQNQNQQTTAQNQSSASSDRDRTAAIRRAIIADKGLSLYAHNVKIITRAGMVTLKGPVKTDAEKQQVAMDAASVVPAEKITNHLTVKQ
jgi:hyperosmotically inducible protein